MLTKKQNKKAIKKQLEVKYEALRKSYHEEQAQLKSLEEARKNKLNLFS